MKQENLKKLLSLMANYIEHVVVKEDSATAVEEIQIFVYNVNNVANQPISDDEKAWMYSETVAALNCGSEEAQKAAFLIRLKALVSGDDELVEKIEYLHKVL